MYTPHTWIRRACVEEDLAEASGADIWRAAAACASAKVQVLRGIVGERAILLRIELLVILQKISNNSKKTHTTSNAPHRNTTIPSQPRFLYRTSFGTGLEVGYSVG